MLKGLLGFLLFIFCVIVLILMLTGRFILKKIREFRKAVEDAAEQQAFQYRTETGRQRQQYNNRQQAQYTQQTQSTQQTQKKRESQQEARRTRTTTGETIIDNRKQKRENKKIFDDSEGEYVEFTEEK